MPIPAATAPARTQNNGIYCCVVLLLLPLLISFELDCVGTPTRLVVVGGLLAMKEETGMAVKIGIWDGENDAVAIILIASMLLLLFLLLFTACVDNARCVPVEDVDIYKRDKGNEKDGKRAMREGEGKILI